MKFRKLKADEIDVRIGQISDKGLSILLYKDARADMNILDEDIGARNWKRSHQLIGDNLYCTVSIKDPDTNEWISKQDVGTESNMEKEKGQASDSFKRACTNWGIGRELYTSPRIWLSDGQFNRKVNNNKPACYDKFRVTRIGYDGNKISDLEIVNDSMKGKIVYSMGLREPEVDLNQKISAKQILTLRAICKKREMPEEEITRLYKRERLEDMTIGDWVDFGKTGEKILEKWDKEH